MFALDERLAADTLPVAELALSRLRLMNDARYPWLILVPMRAGITELHQLAPADRRQLMEEITAASEALAALFRPDKLNVGALGNLVPQLHVHIVARRRGDAAWPGPVWGAGEAVAYPPGDGAALAARLGAALA